MGVSENEDSIKIFRKRMMRIFKLPSEREEEFDIMRGYTRIIDVYICRHCGERFDNPPRAFKRGWIECPKCSSNENYFEKKKIID